MSRQSRRFAKSRQSSPTSVRPAAPAAVARSGFSPRAWAGLCAGAVLAAALYFFLQSRAVQDGLPDTLVIGLPLAVMACAALPLWRRWRNRRRRQSTIQRMDWATFQPLLCLMFEQQGYHLSETGNRPGVVDLVLRKNRQTHLVHAKSWKSRKPGMNEIRELHAAMVTRGAGGGIVVSAGRFSRLAMQFARETHVLLIDGAVLQQWQARLAAASTRPVPAEETCLAAGDTESSARPTTMDTQLLSEFSPTTSIQEAPQAPACPSCGAPMRERTARKGRHAGRRFWGCTRHPVCKGVRRREGGGANDAATAPRSTTGRRRAPAVR